MKIPLCTAAVLLTLILAGCASTGGDILGLFPAPKFLKGDIKDSVYTSKGGGFEVAVPYQEGSYEFHYLQIKEDYHPGDIYVSFGPAAFDQDIYRLDFYPRPAGAPAVDLDQTLPGVVAKMQQTLQDAYGAPAQVVGAPEKQQVAGHDARHWTLRQQLPEGKYWNDKPAVLDQQAYLIDLGDAVAIVEVQHETQGIVRGITAEAFAASVKLQSAAAR